MRIACDTLDDTLRALYPPLLESNVVVPTSRGDTRELLGVSLEIAQPRARLSRTETRGKPFSAIGELLWYLSRDNSLDFIRYYIPRYIDESEDQLTVYGGYGPRLFGRDSPDQVQNVIDLLRARPTTRRAVIQLFSPADLSGPRLEIPCTTTLQFVVRDGLVHMLTTMRSNDAYKGLPHDVFCFTMLQEIIARSVDADIGSYRHFVGSMHLYESDRPQAAQYIEEDVQARIEMPPMPAGDPWPAVRTVLAAEDQIRHGEAVDAAGLGLAEYWADLVRLLQILAATGDEARIDALKAAMSFRRYSSYIEPRKAMRPREPHAPAQPKFRFN